MKGDYVQITYKTPTGVAVEKVQATRDGSSVDTTFATKGATFFLVEELNKAGNAIRSCRFRESEVISVVEGHEMLQRVKRKTK